MVECEKCPNVLECREATGLSLREDLTRAPNKILGWIEDNLLEWCAMAVRETHVSCNLSAIGDNLDAEAAELVEALKRWFAGNPATPPAPSAGEAFPSEVLKKAWEEPSP